MFRAYYNPTQEQDMVSAQDPNIERIFEVSNKATGFVRLRCADCIFRNTVNNLGNLCCPHDPLCKWDDWFCGHFKPMEKNNDVQIAC